MSARWTWSTSATRPGRMRFTPRRRTARISPTQNTPRRGRSRSRRAMAMRPRAAREAYHSVDHAERHRRRDRKRRRRGRGRGNPPAPQAAHPPLQDPGSDQGPADHAGPGRQGGTRQQGRRADHLSVARGPLLRADAQHGAGRRHLPQDHPGRRPQEAEGDRAGDRGAGRRGPDHPHGRRQAHQARDQARLRIPACACGSRCAS